MLLMQICLFLKVIIVSCLASVVNSQVFAPKAHSGNWTSGSYLSHVLELSEVVKHQYLNPSSSKV